MHLIVIYDFLFVVLFREALCSLWCAVHAGRRSIHMLADGGAVQLKLTWNWRAMGRMEVEGVWVKMHTCQCEIFYCAK